MISPGSAGIGSCQSTILSVRLPPSKILPSLNEEPPPPGLPATLASMVIWKLAASPGATLPKLTPPPTMALPTAQPESQPGPYFKPEPRTQFHLNPPRLRY